MNRCDGFVMKLMYSHVDCLIKTLISYGFFKELPFWSLPISGSLYLISIYIYIYRYIYIYIYIYMYVYITNGTLCGGEGIPIVNQWTFYGDSGHRSG